MTLLRSVVDVAAGLLGMRCVDARRMLDLELALELLDASFLDQGPELYDAQGVNQAHRVLTAALRGHGQPVRPRPVRPPTEEGWPW